MRHYTNLWVVLLVAVPFAALAEEPAHETTNFARGARLYSANCGRCHNPRGASEFSDGYWPLIVTHMRVIAGLPGDQAREIEAFLRASNNPPVRVVAKRMPSKHMSGDELIAQYGCRACHKIEGDGGAVGPSLDGLFERRDEDWVRVQIKQPRTHNPKTVMPDMGLGDSEATAIIEVLRRAN